MALDCALEPAVQPCSIDQANQTICKMARRTPKDLGPLEEAIGHVFSHRALLEQALTHVSALPASAGRIGSYQRLEFLGDRVVGLVIARMLFDAFPDDAEGQLSRRLAELVRRESCAEVAVAWGLGPYLRLGAGEALVGVRRNEALLADACEAVIGAVFLDAGFEVAAQVVRRAFQPRMHAPRRPLRDAKTALQEWAQGQGHPTPSYRIVDRQGPDHAPRFVIAVEAAGLKVETGQGRSRREAEQAAAQAFLKREAVEGWNTAALADKDRDDG
jgi:ribonuclease III